MKPVLKLFCMVGTIEIIDRGTVVGCGLKHEIKRSALVEALKDLDCVYLGETASSARALKVLGTTISESISGRFNVFFLIEENLSGAHSGNVYLTHKLDRVRSE